ncbi:MAG: LIM domain-containing protein [Dehalococcoidales bacterium]
MKCSRCGREIPGEESFSHQGQVLCEDCYIEVALHSGKCDPWATYLATHTRESLGMKGTEGLTELQKKVYEFIKSQGKVTREEVKQNLNLSEAEMDAQLTPLMYSELVKERGEGGKIYLVPVN